MRTVDQMDYRLTKVLSGIRGIATGADGSGCDSSFFISRERTREDEKEGIHNKYPCTNRVAPCRGNTGTETVFTDGNGSNNDILAGSNWHVTPWTFYEKGEEREARLASCLER